MNLSEQNAVLEEELQQFRSEKEHIRKVIGSIGGKDGDNRDRFYNCLFLLSVLFLLAIDIMRHVFHIGESLPSMITIEIGLLLVSIKIIWMMHKQMKVEHFQFWILNSIEFRLNEVMKQLREIQDKASRENDNCVKINHE